MEKLVLSGKSREIFAKQLKSLRQSGQLPAVMYGHGVTATPILLETPEVERVYAQAGSNKIVGLKLDQGRAKNVLFQAVQHDAITSALIHADLYVIKMDEKIKTEVPLHFVGESTAVYQEGGTLFKNLDALEIEALPADLPEAIKVDISSLDDFEKAIHVSDLAVPPAATVLLDAEELVARVEPPRSEEELAELEEAPVEELPIEEGAETEAAPGEPAESEETGGTDQKAA